MPTRTNNPARRAVMRWALPLMLLGGALVWVCWPGLAAMVEKWSQDPRYSHGFLVPAFAGFLLWYRREQLDGPVGGRAGGASRCLRWARP